MQQFHNSLFLKQNTRLLSGSISKSKLFRSQLGIKKKKKYKNYSFNNNFNSI